MSTFALFPQKRSFSSHNRPPSPLPAHHSLLCAHYSPPMSTFAFLAQKRSFSAAGAPTGDSPPRPLPTPPDGRASPTKNMSTLSTFAFLAQKRGSSAAGAPTGDSPTRPNSPVRKIEKIRSIFPCFAQNHGFPSRTFTPLLFSTFTLPSGPTPRSAPITHHITHLNTRPHPFPVQPYPHPTRPKSFSTPPSSKNPHSQAFSCNSSPATPIPLCANLT